MKLSEMSENLVLEVSYEEAELLWLALARPELDGVVAAEAFRLRDDLRQLLGEYLKV